MNEMGKQSQEAIILPVTRGGRVLYVFTGIILPILCFGVALSFQDVLLPEWQSGRLADYAKIVIFSPVSFWFAPFLLYTMISLSLLLFDQVKWSCLFAVRFGIYTGVVIGLHFSALIVAALLEHRTDISFFSWIFLVLSVAPALLGFVYRFCARKIGLRRTWGLIVGGVVLSWVITNVVQPDSPNIFFTYMLASSLFSLMAAPVWFTILMILVSKRLAKGAADRSPRSLFLAPLSWVLTYVAAWRFALQNTLEAYSALPQQPPGCYVATAAARGHQFLVGRMVVTTSAGEKMAVNEQLCYLKAFEVILAASVPNIHKTLRALYDLVGPVLAAHVTFPLLADLAYLLLKPAEWMALIVLMVVPRGKLLALRIYGTRP